MEKYQVHKQVGAGAFASVSKATNKSTSEVVAIKKMKKKFANWDECLSLNEIKSLTKLKHPNIIKLIEVIRSNDELFCVFEFAQQTIYSLYLSYKEKGQPVPEPLIKSFIFQTVQGLTFMHKNGFFHRDMKPENLLLCDGNIVKIADFGLAREIRSRPPYTEYVSTRWYRAPELLLRSPNYNSPVDIYALGCIMAELYNQCPLFAGSSEIDQLNKICSVLGTPNYNTWNDGMLLASKIHYTFPQFNTMDLSNVIPSAGDVALSLVRDMLNLDPFKRPTAAQILQHAYFNDVSVPKIIHEKKEKNKESNSPNQIIKKNQRFIVKDKKQAEIGKNTQKNDIFEEILKENQDLQRDTIKTPLDSPENTENISPTEIFRKFKKKEEEFEDKKTINRPSNIINNKNNDDDEFEFDFDNAIKDKVSIPKEKPSIKNNEDSFELEKEIEKALDEPENERKNSFSGFNKKIEKEIENDNKNFKEPNFMKSSFNKKNLENPLSNRELPNNMKTPFWNKKGGNFGNDDEEDDKEFSHSVSPLKQHEKFNVYNENSLERNRDLDFPSNKSKEINFFQKKQVGPIQNPNPVFQSKQFTDFKGNLEIKPKLNLPKLSPIGNVKDLKEKSDFGGIFQPENSGINNNGRFYAGKNNDLMNMGEDSHFGFKSTLFPGTNKLPELQKISSNNNKLGNSYFNVREDRSDRNKVSPNKKIVNLDPIQYFKE